jgi:hypothetical protein
MRHEPSLALHAQVCLVCGLRTRSSSEFAPWCLSSHPIDYICRKPLTSNPAPPCPLSYANSAPSTTLISFSLVYHQFFLRCRTFLLALDVIYFYVTCTSFTTLRSLYFCPVIIFLATEFLSKQDGATSRCTRADMDGTCTRHACLPPK